MAAAGGEAVQKALQSVAQSTGWTYSLLWRLCPRQGYELRPTFFFFFFFVLLLDRRSVLSDDD